MAIRRNDVDRRKDGGKGQRRPAHIGKVAPALKPVVGPDQPQIGDRAELPLQPPPHPIANLGDAGEQRQGGVTG